MQSSKSLTKAIKNMRLDMETKNPAEWQHRSGRSN